MWLYLYVDCWPQSSDLPGHRGRPSLRGVLQTTSPGAAAGGDDTQAGLGSHVSDSSTNQRQTWCCKPRGLSSLCREICPSVTHGMSDSSLQMQLTPQGINHLNITVQSCSSFDEIDRCHRTANWDELIKIFSCIVNAGEWQHFQSSYRHETVPAEFIQREQLWEKVSLFCFLNKTFMKTWGEHHSSEAAFEWETCHLRASEQLTDSR